MDRVRNAVLRLARMIVTIVAVSMLTFLGTSLLPGDPARTILGENSTDEVAYQELRDELGLDDPLPERYAAWAGGVLEGDLGRSYRSDEAVLDQVRQALPPTIELLLLAEVFALVVAVPLAIATASRAGGLLDRAVTTVTFGLLALPGFAVAIVLIFVFAVTLDVLPATGYRPFTEDPAENLRRMVLPALSIGLGLATVYLRVLRAELITALEQPHILFARAKGMSRRRILWRHALPASALSLLTVVGISVGTLVGGAVIVETLFGIEGMGSLLVTAVSTREYRVVQGVVLVVATSYVVINTLVDGAYRLLDPRVAAS